MIVLNLGFVNRIFGKRGEDSRSKAEVTTTNKPEDLLNANDATVRMMLEYPS